MEGCLVPAAAPETPVGIRLPTAPETESGKEPVPWMRTDWVLSFAGVAVALVMAVVYLSSRASGANWAMVGVPLDDTWIHLVYARNLAESGHFWYNPGVPEAGMSSPLWVVVLAVVYKLFGPLGLSPQWCAKGPALACALAVPVLTYLVARALGLGRGWALAAMLLVAVDPNLSYGSVAGMEVPLLSLLTLLALYLVARRQYLWAGMALGLGVVTRGEGAVTALVIGAIPVLREYLKRHTLAVATRRELELGLALFLPSLLLGGAWALYNHSINGTFLPNTYYIKHNFALGWVNVSNLLGALGGFVRHLALFKGPLLVVSTGLIAALVYSLRRHRQFDLGLSLLLVTLAQFYAFSINVKVGALPLPWTYCARRYLDYLIPLLVILVVGGASYLWAQASRLRHRAILLATPLLVFAVIGLSASGIIGLNRLFIEWYSWDTENIEVVDVAMARWVAENLPAGATIAVTDAGAIRFFARPGQVIMDFMGLNDHHCMGRPCVELLHEFRPQYALFFRYRDPLWDYFEQIHSLSPKRLTILGGGELVALRIKDYPPWPPE